MSTFQPLLASKITRFNKLNFANLLASPKLDGIRAIIKDGLVVSRKMKPIPNRHVQDLFANQPDLEGYDGELIVGEPFAANVYRVTNSGVMAIKGKPDVTFHVFDRIDRPDMEYENRLMTLLEHDNVEIVPQYAINGAEELLKYETRALEQGYEGMMLRARRGLNSLYKFGRATEASQTLMKLKRFSDFESVVIGFEEEMKNNNEATKDAFGRTERSSHQDNKVGKGRLGALVCLTPEGIEFKIGTGFDAADREDIWQRQDELIGVRVKYKSFSIGVKDAPRFPVWLGWRDPIDL